MSDSHWLKYNSGTLALNSCHNHTQSVKILLWMLKSYCVYHNHTYSWSSHTLSCENQTHAYWNTILCVTITFCIVRSLIMSQSHSRLLIWHSLWALNLHFCVLKSHFKNELFKMWRPENFQSFAFFFDTCRFVRVVSRRRMKYIF
jgi:hypothetical protein